MEEVYVKTQVEALKDNQKKLTVTIEAEDVNTRIKKTYKDFAHKYKFP
ncbi:MAG: trigger factor, partial [Raoultibacter sp.]